MSGTGNSLISLGSVTDGAAPLETVTVSVATTSVETLVALFDMLSKVLVCVEVELASALLL